MAVKLRRLNDVLFFNWESRKLFLERAEEGRDGEGLATSQASSSSESISLATSELGTQGQAITQLETYYYEFMYNFLMKLMQKICN